MKEYMRQYARRSVEPLMNSLREFGHDISYIKEVGPAMKHLSKMIGEEVRAKKQQAVVNTKEFFNKKETKALLKALGTNNLAWILLGLGFLVPIDYYAGVKPISEGLNAGIPFDETMRLYWSFITQSGMGGPILLGLLNALSGTPIVAGTMGIVKDYKKNLLEPEKKKKKTKKKKT